MGKSRLEAFSDGVIAIIITIMVLELRAPHSAHLTDLGTLWPVFLSYVLSFIYIGIYWNNHHHMLHVVHQVTGGVLWANLHGSFAIGVALLGCCWVGRLLEVAWHERSVAAVFADREGRRLLLWTELAAAAVLLNPYAIDAWLEAIRFSSNANLRDVLEWNPLQLLGIGGLEFAISSVVAAFVYQTANRDQKLPRKPLPPKATSN